MSSPGSPAEAQAYIVERLVGAIGEPDHVLDAARATGLRALPVVVDGIAHALDLQVTAELSTVELTRFADAAPSDPKTTAMCVVASTSSPDALMMVMDGAAVGVLVSAVFGGDPDIPGSPIERDLSPTEIEVCTMLFQEVARAINGSGERAFDLKLPVAAALTGIDIDKHVLRDGPAVRLVMDIVAPTGRCPVSLFMPQRVLMKHRGGTGIGAESMKASDWRARFGEEVMRSNVTLEATMPLAKLTLGNVDELRPGSVIEFEPDAMVSARLSARNRQLFVCEFGKLGQNYTVRVRHPFDAAQDFMDGLMRR